MKNRLPLFLSFTLGVAGICLVSGYFLDQKVLAWSVVQARSGMAPLTDAYKEAEGSRSRKSIPNLESINEAFMKKPGAALGRTPPRFLMNLGPDGSRRAIQVEKEQARNLLLGYNRVHEELMLRGQAFDRGSRTLYLKEEVPYIRLGVFHTVLGVSGLELENKRLWLAGALTALWALASGVMAVVVFSRGNGNRIPSTIRQPDRPSRFATSEGARPMEGHDPFKPRRERPVGERFFREEYLAKGEPAPTAEMPPEIPPRLRTFQEVVGKNPSKTEPQ